MDEAIDLEASLLAALISATREQSNDEVVDETSAGKAYCHNPGNLIEVISIVLIIDLEK